MRPKWATTAQKDTHDLADGVGNLLLDSFRCLARATLVMRFGSNRHPSGPGDDAGRK